MSLASDRTGPSATRRKTRSRRGARIDPGGSTRENTNLAAAVDIAMVIVVVRATLTRGDGARGAYAAAPAVAAAPTLKPAAGRADSNLLGPTVARGGVKSIPRGLKPRRVHRRARAPKGAFDRLDPVDRRRPHPAERSGTRRRAKESRFIGRGVSVRARARDAGPAARQGAPTRPSSWTSARCWRGTDSARLDRRPRGQPPRRRRPLGSRATLPPRDVVDPSDDSSWHVSESVDGDDAVDDAGAAESARASSPPRGVKRDAPDGPSDPHDERHPRSFARRNVRNRDEDAPLSYGDAVDLDRAAAAAASTSTTASTDASRRLFFLPRGHPARPPDPPPDRWRVALDRIRDARSGRTASVDVFHEFLLSLRGAPDAHFQALVASLLSVQCRDGVALVAARRLRDALGGDITQAAVREPPRSTTSRRPSRAAISSAPRPNTSRRARTNSRRSSRGRFRRRRPS